MLINKLKRLGGASRGLLFALIATLLGLPFPIVLMFFMCGGCSGN